MADVPEQRPSDTGPTRFRDQVAIITGADQGIGRAVADRLTVEGATVVLVDRNGYAAEVAAGLGSASHLVADLADPAQCASVVPEVEQVCRSAW